MLTGKHASRQTHPSLFPLRAALSAAESLAPARPACPDLNEQRAAQLITRLQAEYKKPALFAGLQEIPSPHGLSTVPVLQTQAS